jgi:hypothetical protein
MNICNLKFQSLYHPMSRASSLSFSFAAQPGEVVHDQFRGALGRIQKRRQGALGADGFTASASPPASPPASPWPMTAADNHLTLHPLEAAW